MNLKFESLVDGSLEDVWNSITSLKGLTAEMLPLMRLTAPKGFKTLSDIYPRKNDFRSWVLLFGILPIDHTDLNLKSLTPLKGFVEESKMASMKYWRHERTLISVSPKQTRVIDELTFEPVRFAQLSAMTVKMFFQHRHKRLKKMFHS